MSKPTISVIVPVYNTERYLHRCIDSILTQTYTEFELLLVDDGSQDNSGTICDKYASKDARIRVFHKENGGVSSARNLGLNNASGEWVCFVDSDDFVNHSFLESFYNLDDSPDICFQGLIFQLPNKRYISQMDDSLFSNSLEETLLLVYRKKLFGWGCNKLFKRSILLEHRIRFNTNLHIREDELFTLDFCRWAKTISISNKADYNYEMHDLSLISRPKDPIKYIKINTQLHEAASYFKNIELQRFEEAKFTAETLNAIKWMYSNGTLLDYDINTRIGVIQQFTGNKHALRSIVVFYNTAMTRLIYCVLWLTKSPRLIDYFFQLRYRIKYSY